MYKIVRKSEAKIRKVAENKTAYNLITKEHTPKVSLAVIEGKNYKDIIMAEYNWIYFVIDGVMTLKFGNEKYSLEPGDSCYVTKGQKYEMSGTFKSVIVSQPAFGT